MSDLVVRPQTVRISAEIICIFTERPLVVTLSRRDGRGSDVVMPLLRYNDSPTCGIELDADQRAALLLPLCDARNGGSHLTLWMEGLCEARQRIPRAPTCWKELVEAELMAITGVGPDAPYTPESAH
jgi:hypothetical protein